MSASSSMEGARTPENVRTHADPRDTVDAAGIRRPHAMLVWLTASRPQTLSAALAPVAVGFAAAVHGGAWQALPAVAALFATFAIQIGTNFANDVFDFEKGADTKERLGPLRVTQAGWLTPAQVRRAMAASFGLALLPGAYLIAVGGWPILLIGTLAILSGIAYTGGPWPLGYKGLGDLFVFVFFGLVATAGTAYVASGAFSWLALLLGIPLGALATGILVVNNLRDRTTDVRAGKRTLVVRLGAAFGIAQYRGLLLLAFAVPLSLFALGTLTPWILLPLLTLPEAIRLARRVGRVHGASLNPLLAGTARLLLIFALLLAGGISHA